MQKTFIITITGLESTGKSTLSAALAARLECQWRKEMAREYLEHLDREYKEADLLQIHARQEAETQKQLLQQPPFLVLDTDAQVLQGWSEIKWGRCATPILETVALHPPHLYLLPGIEAPWQPDPLREHPALKDRQRLWRYYHEAVQESGIPFALLAGGPAEQLERAMQALERLRN